MPFGPGDTSLKGKKATPWAVLLCKFSDDDSEPHPRSFYESLFTELGRGTSNMGDFFFDVSHGAIGLTGTKVFGWYTLPYKRSDYKGSGPNWKGRADLVTWAKAAAKADPTNPVDADDGSWFGVVVSMNVSTDLFGGPGAAVCDPNTLDPSLLGQEMGHGYGLAHSRADGSPEDYQDPWDIMSTWSPYEAPHPDYGHIGPGMNAANMAGRGWLNESRVWTASSESADVIIALRPLHHRRPGYLAARLGEFLIEFRVKEAWDAAIPRPAILVHRFEDNHSYLMRGKTGGQDLVKDDVFELGSEASTSALVDEWTRVDVIDIDPASRRATLRLRHRAAYYKEPLTYPLPWPVIHKPVIAQDVGAIIFAGGRVISVSPRTPVFRLLRAVATIEVTALIRDQETRMAAQREALSAIADEVQSQLAELGPYSETPPLQLPDEDHQDL